VWSVKAFELDHSYHLSFHYAIVVIIT
jgi:hypothetical protein